VLIEEGGSVHDGISSLWSGFALAFEGGIMVHGKAGYYAWCLDTEILLVAINKNTVKVLQTLAILQ
jgi:hypothetical protein